MPAVDTDTVLLAVCYKEKPAVVLFPAWVNSDKGFASPLMHSSEPALVSHMTCICVKVTLYWDKEILWGAKKQLCSEREVLIMSTHSVSGFCFRSELTN